MTRFQPQQTTTVPLTSSTSDAPPVWLGVDWRQHLRQIEVEGAKINYVDIGAGEPILFLHGIDACWQTWLDNVPHFADRYRVIAVDLPGCAESSFPAELPAGGPTIGWLADVVAALAERLDAQRLNLVGHSMGGQIAVELAARRPELVQSLTLVSPGGIRCRISRPKTFSPGARMLYRTARILAQIGDGAVKRSRVRRLIMRLAARRPQDLRPELVYEMLLNGTAKGNGQVLDLGRAIVGHDLQSALPLVEAPTLIVWGRDDLLVPVRDADAYAASIPRARKVIYEGVGHGVQFEVPGPFNALLEEHVSAAAQGRAKGVSPVWR